MGDPIKVAVCEALLAINADDPDPAHPFIPPTAIDWIGDLVGCRVRSGLEGHAVIDGEVVALELNEVVSLRGRLRWEADEDEPPCPVCGGEPGDTTMHTESCPTLGTCGQTEPDLDPPWHRDEEWWDGKERYSVAFDRHVRTAHRTPTGGAPDTEGRPHG